MRYLFTSLFLLALLNNISAQYPSGYFRNPLGIPMQLVANFGEVRTDHFHMGFDLRTNQRENLPVYAAAEGYVSRITISAGGYGRCIFITHPNGYTTLYAHLNNFYPALQQFVESKQYSEEKWEQDIAFEKGKFTVSKGQFIAYSGNSGSSQGPHLHFEVRETKTDLNINPRLFNFPVKDNIAPLVYKVYLYDRNYSTYAVDPSEIKIKKIKAGYVTKDAVVKTGSGKISFGISAEDLGNTSSFRYGIYAAELWVDGKQQFGFSLDKLNNDDNRYMNASVDYKKRVSSGTLVQHLSRLPGNMLSIFEGLHDGVILLTDTLPHQVMIKVKDVNGNQSEVSFSVKQSPELYQRPFFTQDREILVPNQKNKFVRENIRVDFPATALYDTVPFYHAEITTGHNNLPMHQLHYPYVPVHDDYTVSVKPEGIPDTSKIIWRMGTAQNSYTEKAIFKNGWFIGSFNRFGNLSLIKDTIAPMVYTVGWKDGSVFGKSGSITVNVKDDVSSVDYFRAELDGKWLMFSRKGNTFRYAFDAYCTLGNHQLKITIKDIAGNETIRTYNFELKEKLPVKKKAKKSTKKRKK